VNVAILHPSFKVYGGAELAIVKLARNLIREGDNVSIYTLGMSSEVRKELEGVDIKCFKSIKALKDTLHHSLNSIDVVNSHNHPMELMLYPVKIPHVWSHNEPPDLVLRGRRHSLMELAIISNSVDKIVVFSEYNRERARELYGVEDIRVVPFGVDTEYYDRRKANISRAEEELGINEDDFVVVHPGWMSYFKNQFDSLLAYVELKDKIPNLKLVYFGVDSTEYGRLIKRAVKAHKLTNVIVAGFIPNSLKRDLYARCNLALFPYREQGGFISIFEALSMECPVAVSSKAPCQEYLKGLCYIMESSKEAILKAYNGEITPSRKAREYIKRNLTWEKYSSSMREIFNETLY